MAYYGELLEKNMEELQSVRFLHPQLLLDSPRVLARTLLPSLRALDPSDHAQGGRPRGKGGLYGL